MKKIISFIMLPILMVSLTACGSNSNNTSENPSKNELTQEVSGNKVEDEKTVDSEEEKESEAKSKEDKTTKKKEKESKESESSVNEETTSENDVKTTDKKESDVETATNEKSSATNEDSDKPESTTEPTKETAEPTTATVQSQTFNVNIDNYGNFVFTLDGNATVIGEVHGWSTDLGDDSYKLNIYVTLAAQDAGKKFNYEIKCPDNVKNSTMTNYDTGYQMPFDITISNGTINGTATATSEGENGAVWICWVLM